MKSLIIFRQLLYPTDRIKYWGRKSKYEHTDFGNQNMSTHILILSSRVKTERGGRNQCNSMLENFVL